LRKNANDASAYGGGGAPLRGESRGGELRNGGRGEQREERRSGVE